MWHSEAVERVTEGARNSDWDIASAGHGPADARGSSEPPGSDEDPEFASDADRERRAAEPLRATWRPAGTTPPERPRRSGLKKFTSTFGWRAYLVPVLLVVTALVVWDTTQKPAPGDSASSSSPAGPGGGDGGAADSTAIATEIPAEKIRLDIPTAELPEGGAYSKTGEGTWHTVPLSENSGERAGDSGQLFTYTIDVEDGLDPGSFGGDDIFAATVEATLSDDRKGWAGTGDVSLQRVDDTHPEPNFRVSLTSPETTKQLCGDAIKYEASCYTSAHGRVVINLARWVRGAKAFSGNMISYQQYVINHEVGHALGNSHVGCDKDGGLAPVMMQQSFGVANDYVAKLNDLPGGDRDAVPADGKVCQPNAWPVPQPKGD